MHSHVHILNISFFFFLAVLPVEKQQVFPFMELAF